MKLLKENAIEKDNKNKGTIYKANNIESDLDITLLDDLNEDVNEIEITNAKGRIEKVLDRALVAAKQANRHGYADCPNILFIGPAGCGKTSRVMAWAKHNGINLVCFDAKSLDETDLGGAIAPDKETGTVKRYSTTELDQLDKPNSVLFLDELNRAPSSVRSTLLTLIQDHTVSDVRVEGRSRRLKGFLFTIACINPSNNDYETERLDAAMRDRFMEVKIVEDPAISHKYLMRYFDSEIEKNIAEGNEQAAKKDQGRKNIVDALLTHPNFSFDYDLSSDGDDKAFSTRSLKKLLQYCDGTKDDFLDNWDDYCNAEKKEMAIEILKKYNDKDDKANDALKNHETESDLFKQKSDIADDLLNSLDSI